mgnify:CR=1 FL=1
MLAIINIAGKQFKTSKDQELTVPRLGIEIGKKVEFDNVLFYSDEKGCQFGKPNLKGASVTATVLAHNRERKILIYKKKRRKGYQRKNGHRQWYSKIKIETITLSKPKKSTSKPKIVSTQKKEKSVK